MKFFLTVSLVVLALKGFSQEKIDTSRIAILPYDEKTRFLFTDSKPLVLLHEDLESIENLLKKCVKSNNLIPYRRQYVAVVNEKGEKIIWVNCFCDEYYKISAEWWSGNWKEDIQWVIDDSGLNKKDNSETPLCYFQLRLNLSSGQCY